jgi:acetate kinase
MTKKPDTSHSDVIVTMNVGSSSVKFSVVELDTFTQLAVGKVSGLGGDATVEVKDFEHKRNYKKDIEEKDVPTAIKRVVNWVKTNEKGHRLVAAAHRVLHGGTTYTVPVIATPEILAELDKLSPLNPLHQPFNLIGVRTMMEAAPEIPQVLCFDTAFHSTNPELFTMLPFPKAYREKGLRRFGFHGLAYESVMDYIAENRPDLMRARLVLTQLGSGASACGVVNGESIANTMGMTALGGLPMSTRPGDTDPGALMFMLLALKMSPEEVQKVLYKECGLKGISGGMSEVKELLEDSGPDASRALDYYVLKVAQYIAAMSVSVGGLQALVFSGGVGENSKAIREAILARLSYVLPPFEVLVVPANEEDVLARYAAVMLDQINGEGEAA